MDKKEIRIRAEAYIRKESDPDFRKEVENLLAEEKWQELNDRHWRDLEFGTGGLRGIIGGGWNRMNNYVVRRATQGLATYLLKAFPQKELSVAIAYDSRNYSDIFAEAAALVFAANGIKAYLFSALRPTPELSFAIRHLGCVSGLVITASHNPPQYNGYKAYWNDGAQVVPPHDTGIIEEVNKVSEVKEISREEAIAKGLLALIDKEVDEPYADMVRSLLLRPDLIRERAKEVPIVYTPLHGTGAFHVEGILESLGLKVKTVSEQREPDGAFPTVAFPNPEEAAALEMAIALGKKEKAAVVMATDPDSDRLGIAVPNSEGEFVLITGNQLGALFADYIFLSHIELGLMPKKAAMVNTIVTTGMHRRIAESYGATCLECLTGFKWIAAIMAQLEKEGGETKVLLGTEESYGYLMGDKVRDKDAISAAAVCAEMTIYWRSKGKSLLDRLDQLYLEHGYWEEFGISKYFEGADGANTIKKIMEEYRNNPPATLGGLKVLRIRDIKESISYELGKKEMAKTVDFPKSDVLQFFLEDGTVVSARPSGTEPKIKFYGSSCTTVTDGDLKKARAESAQKLKAIAGDIRAVIGD